MAEARGFPGFGKELIDQINFLADQEGFMVSHGICNTCKKIMLSQMEKDSEYINLNKINIGSKTKIRRMWNVS